LTGKATEVCYDGGVRYLTTGDLVELWGASYRLLQYWSETGLVSPLVVEQGERTRFRWSVEEAVKVGVILQLRETGVSGPWVRRVFADGGYDALVRAAERSGSVVMMDSDGGLVMVEFDRLREEVEERLSEVGVEV